MSIGQNVAGGYRTWEQAVQMWWDEIDMWTYGVDPDSYLGPGGWRKIGHFTQVHTNQFLANQLLINNPCNRKNH
jgi:hypothetical protein